MFQKRQHSRHREETYPHNMYRFPAQSVRSCSRSATIFLHEVWRVFRAGETDGLDAARGINGT